MVPSYVYDLRKAFEFEKKLLLYAGFYPNRGSINKYLQYLLGFFHVSITILILLSLTVVIALHIDNLSTITDALMFFVTQISFTFKVANVVRKKELFCRMEEILAQPIFYRLSYEGEKIIEHYVTFTHRFARCFRIICFLVCATSGTLPLVGGHAMLLGWNPWESTDAIKYYLNSTFQLTALCISAYVNSTIDILTATLIAIATAQIEILKNNLVNIRYDREAAKDEFNENIRLHYEILRFVNALDRSLSVGILGQIFASVLVICVTGFQLLIVSVLTIEGAFLLIYLFCMMFQVAIYCWFGHYLIDSSDTIIQSVYMSNWYEARKCLRKSIIIFMERCKQPIILRIGGLFPLSLGTFTSIIRSSYSYFAVLRRWYEPE